MLLHRLFLQHFEDPYRLTGGGFAIDEVLEFSFATNSTKLQLDVDKHQFNDDAEVEIVSASEIRKVATWDNILILLLCFNV